MDKQESYRNERENLDNLGERLTPERVAFVDKLYETPKQRGEQVWQHLQKADFTRWDMLCFCVEYVGQMGRSLFSDDRMLKSISLLLGRWLYEKHYFHAKEMYGEPEALTALKGKKEESVHGVRTNCSIPSTESLVDQIRSVGLDTD